MINRFEIEKDIVKYKFNANDFTDAERISEILAHAYDQNNLGTYGGVNTDVLFEEISGKGYEISREEICAQDDDDIGLRMPNFWPINIGPYSLSIAMYYCGEQMRYSSGWDNFPDWNRKARDNFGWISMVEIQDTKNLLQRIKDERMDFFSTPYTLTECMRFLEGWNLDRLKKYKSYALQIREWAEKQEFYDSSEWDLGRETSKELMRNTGRITNVRFAIKKYWQNVLINQMPQNGDREINIVSRNFSYDRCPDIVLLGEDFFPLNGRFTTNLSSNQEVQVFNYNIKGGIQHRVPLNETDPDDKALKTAYLTREKYPDSKIILLSHSDSQKRLFKLIKGDNVKEGINLEVILASMAWLDSIGDYKTVRELEKCLK